MTNPTFVDISRTSGSLLVFLLNFHQLFFSRFPFFLIGVTLMSSNPNSLQLKKEKTYMWFSLSIWKHEMFETKEQSGKVSFTFNSLYQKSAQYFTEDQATLYRVVLLLSRYPRLITFFIVIASQNEMFFILNVKHRRVLSFPKTNSCAG